MSTQPPIDFTERHVQTEAFSEHDTYKRVVVIGDYRTPAGTSHRLRVSIDTATRPGVCDVSRWDGSQWHSIGSLTPDEIRWGGRHNREHERDLAAFKADQEKLLRLAAAVLDEPELPAPSLEEQIGIIVQSHELGPDDLHALGELAEQTLEAVRENFSGALSPRKVLAHLLFELHGRYDDVPDTTPAFDPEMLVAGDDVIVDEPKHVSSTHQHGFAGTFVGRQGAYFLVRDQEDNVFSVEADEIFGRDE